MTQEEIKHEAYKQAKANYSAISKQFVFVDGFKKGIEFYVNSMLNN